jgi:hypothetical protein
VRRRIRHRWSDLSLGPRIGLVVLAVLVVILLGALVLKWIPAWLATGGLRGKNRAEEIGRTRTAVLASIAGLIALTGAIFTGLSYRLNREGQITDRFTRAIDQIGRPELEVRLGGIYALERIARDSRDDHPQVFEVLTAFVRERSPRQGDERMPVDVQAAMRVIARRNPRQDAGRLGLRGADLRGMELGFGEVHFSHADLSETNLARISLIATDLSHATLAGATLVYTKLELVNLRRASLASADLARATLLNCFLNGADLSGASLTGLDLSGAMYDDETRWPEGFDPAEHGARKV